MIVGAAALGAFGVPRSTLGIDVQVRSPGLGKHESEFSDWIVEERNRDPVFGQETLTIHSAGSPIPFELFFTDHWFTKKALDRRRTVESRLLGGPIPIPTIEDFILLKACHMVHSSRSRSKAVQDGVDIEGVVQAHRRSLDVSYLKENGTKLGCWDALRPLLENDER